MTGPITPRPTSPLPSTLPIFPLTGALLLPGAQLPLNIFEPRYLRMVDDVLGGNRLIGMIQQSDDGDRTGPPPLFDVGCAGRITMFSETNDGRYHIALTGVSRFSMTAEVSTDTPYRLADADWSRFDLDCHDDNSAGAVDRDLFLEIMSDYLHASDLEADWDAATSASIESLVLSLSMGCPFAPNEKQALLEAHTIYDRAECLMALMEMAGGEEPTVQ